MEETAVVLPVWKVRAAWQVVLLPALPWLPPQLVRLLPRQCLPPGALRSRWRRSRSRPRRSLFFAVCLRMFLVLPMQEAAEV